MIQPRWRMQAAMNRSSRLPPHRPMTWRRNRCDTCARLRLVLWQAISYSNDVIVAAAVQGAAAVPAEPEAPAAEVAAPAVEPDVGGVTAHLNGATAETAAVAPVAEAPVAEAPVAEAPTSEVPAAEAPVPA